MAQRDTLTSRYCKRVTSADKSSRSRPEQVRLHLEVVKEQNLTHVLRTMASRSTVRSVAFMRWPMEIDQARYWASSSIDEGHDDRFVARLKGTNEVVGCSCLWQSPDEPPELGYWIMEGHRCLGFGLELADLTLHYAQKNWDTHRFTAITSRWNRPSQQILTKLGFQIIGETSVRTGDGALRPSLKWLRAGFSIRTQTSVTEDRSIKSTTAPGAGNRLEAQLHASEPNVDGSM